MADWFGARRNVKWRYMRVSWDTWEEGGEYASVTGGSSEESYFTSVKGGGSLTFVGELVSNYDLVRTYYEFTDDNGDNEKVAVCTMLVDVSSTEIDHDGLESGSAALYSVLKVADDRQCGLPLTITAGTKAVEYAESMLKGLGLKVSATHSDYTVATDHTFKPDDTYLTVVNWLMSVAGYGSASPDPYGTIVLAPYVDASNREPAFTFRADRKSIMYPRVLDETNFGSTPNVVRLFSEDEYGGYWAVASNVDADSPTSLPSRGGRERTLYEEVTQLEPAYDPGEDLETADENAKLRRKALEVMARQKLLDNSAEIEYVTISHGFYPLSQGDSVRIEYADRAWQGTVTNVKRDNNVESKCELKVRKYVQHDLDTEIVSGVIL